MAGQKQQVILVLATLAAIVGFCSAATVTVGDKTGWTIPPSPSFYTNWASKQSLKVGDVLAFNFPLGSHTVAEVSKSAYDSCTTTSPIGSVMTTAPANVTLTSAGTKYYICTITGHCSAGQKLSIAATGAAPKASKKAPSAAPAAAPTTAPTPSSAATATPPAAAAGSPATSPSGDFVPSVPTASGPAAGGAAPPPENSFAAPAATGFSLLSLVSVAAMALLV